VSVAGAYPAVGKTGAAAGRVKDDRASSPLPDDRFHLQSPDGQYVFGHTTGNQVSLPEKVASGVKRTGAGTGSRPFSESIKKRSFPWLKTKPLFPRRVERKCAPKTVRSPATIVTCPVRANRCT